MRARRPRSLFSLSALLCLALAVGTPACSDDPPKSRDIPCAETRDCPGGLFCGCDGICYVPAACGSEADCCANESCIGGRCQERILCEVDGDCTGGRECHQCACLPPSCESSADCPGDRVCEGGACLDAADLPCGGCAGESACFPVEDACVTIPASCAGQQCGAGETLIIAGTDEHLGPVCQLSPTCVCASARAIPDGRFGTDFSALPNRGGFVALAYDSAYGDLVYVEVTSSGEPSRVEHVDGVPADAAAIGDPAGPRGGVVEPGPNVGQSPSVARAPGSEELAVAYRDRDAGSLRFALRTPDGQWGVTTVDEHGDTGWDADLLWLPDDRWAVAYFGRASGESGLRLAISATDRPSSPSDWRLATAVSGPDPSPEGASLPRGVGQRPAMALLDGTLYVAYYDGIEGDLGLAYGPPDGPWLSVVLDSGQTRSELPGSGDVGLDAALEASPDGRLSVAYLDGISGEVLYGVIDTSPPAGQPIGLEAPPVAADLGRQQSPPSLLADLSLAFTADGRPMLAYQDATFGNLVLAFQEGGEWQQTVIVQDGLAGFSPHVFPGLPGSGDATWVLHGAIRVSGDGDVAEAIDVRPIPFQ